MWSLLEVGAQELGPSERDVATWKKKKKLQQKEGKDGIGCTSRLWLVNVIQAAEKKGEMKAEGWGGRRRQTAARSP